MIIAAVVGLVVGVLLADRIKALIAAIRAKL